MKTFLITAVFAFLAIKVNSQDLEKYQWKHRLLLLVSTEQGGKENSQQLKWLRNNSAGLEERKLLVYQITPGYFLKGLGTSRKEKIQGGNLFSTYATKGQDFELVLIGLDGYEKYRNNSPVNVKSIFGRIDAMPMRRNEIRRSQQKQN